jgi:hypothetical protein
MNRKIATLALAAALGGGIVAPIVLFEDAPALAQTVNKKKKPPRHYRNENMPGTNFRAARPEEYPYIHSCDPPWRLCGNFYLPPYRWHIPVDRYDRRR